MSDENKNLILAIALSMAILIGWQYFFAAPKAERQRLAAAAAAIRRRSTRTPRTRPHPRARPAAPPGPCPGHGPIPPAATTVETRAGGTRPLAARRRSTRPRVRGSINLRGGRIDDVSLKNYHETVDPKSPNIVLFSPAGAPEPLLRRIRLGRRARPARRCRTPTRSGRPTSRR